MDALSSSWFLSLSGQESIRHTNTSEETQERTHARTYIDCPVGPRTRTHRCFKQNDVLIMLSKGRSLSVNALPRETLIDAMHGGHARMAENRCKLRTSADPFFWEMLLWEESIPYIHARPSY